MSTKIEPVKNAQDYFKKLRKQLKRIRKERQYKGIKVFLIL